MKVGHTRFLRVAKDRYLSYDSDSRFDLWHKLLTGESDNDTYFGFERREYDEKVAKPWEKLLKERQKKRDTEEEELSLGGWRSEP